MNRRIAATLLAPCLAFVVLAACGGEEDAEAEVDTTPVVGLFEIPISRNNQASAPSDAVRVEVSPTVLRLNYEPVLDLERGRPADGAVTDHIITALRSGIQGDAARSRASIRIHANVPYLTLVEILNTFQSAGLREVLIAVRTPGESPTDSWMQLPHYQVIAADAEPEFEGRAPRWDTFVEHWRAIYDACRAGRYVDCDGPYSNTAAGGDLDMILWTRGQGMKVTYRQGANAPEAETAEGGGGGVAMIEGVAAAPDQPAAEDEGTPATEGAFTVRHQESTAEGDSALSAVSAPVCADTQCRAIFTTDATTPSMRVISMLGAVFPNGTERP
ncbi:MAG TPA: hypothetical protein ENK57_07135, partial [Polyangiaceae bacterium]|nr:hypothetical protein [Polyangiaceae bacterium]